MERLIAGETGQIDAENLVASLDESVNPACVCISAVVSVLADKDRCVTPQTSQMCVVVVVNQLVAQGTLRRDADARLSASGI